MRITESQLRKIVRKLVYEGVEDDDFGGRKTADAVQKAMDGLGISVTDVFGEFMSAIEEGNIPDDIDAGGVSWWSTIADFIDRNRRDGSTAAEALKAVEVASQEMWGYGPPDNFYESWDDQHQGEPENEHETMMPCDSCGKNFPEDELNDIENSGYGPYICAQCLADKERTGIPFGVPKNDYEIPKDLLNELIGYVGKNYEISDDAAEVIRWTLEQGTHELLSPPDVDEVYRGLLLDMDDLKSLGVPDADWESGRTYTFKGSFPVRFDRTAQSWTDSKSVAGSFAGWRQVGKGEIAVIWEASTYDNGDVFLDLNPIYVHFGREAGITKQDEREVLAVPEKPIIAKKIWIKVGK